MWDVVLDAVLDTLKLFPFLLLAYVLIELLEHKTDLGRPHGALSGRLAPLIGGATGLIPQCGFSVLAAKLYESRHITLGTLFAVFLATSDEALIVLIASGEGAASVMPMLAVKIVIAVGMGYLIDLCNPRKKIMEITPEEHFEGTSCGREHDGKSPAMLYFVSPLLHALKVAAFILLVNFLFGVLYFEVGEEAVKSFLQAGLWIQPLVACLIGLIPNCASSVALTQTYLLGGITFGSCVGGLCANAGLGALVLLKNTKKWRRNLLIVGMLFLIGVATGYLVNALEILIF